MRGRAFSHCPCIVNGSMTERDPRLTDATKQQNVDKTLPGGSIDTSGIITLVSGWPVLGLFPPQTYRMKIAFVLSWVGIWRLWR